MIGRLRSGKLRATPEKDGVLLRNSGKKIIQKKLFVMMPKESGSVDNGSPVSTSEAVGGRKGEQCDRIDMETVVCGLPSCPGKKRSRDVDDEWDEGPGTVIKKAKEETLHGEVRAVRALRSGNAARNKVGEEDGKLVKNGGQNSGLGMKTDRPKEDESNDVAQELLKKTKKKKGRRGRPPKIKVVESEAEHGRPPKMQKHKQVVKTKAKRGRPPKIKEEKEVSQSEATETVKEEEVLESEAAEAVKSEEDESNKVAEGLMMKRKKKGKRGRPRKVREEDEVLKIVDVEEMKYEEDKSNGVAEGLMKKKGNCGWPWKIPQGNEVLTRVDVEAVKSEEDKSNEIAQGLMNKKKKKKGKRGRPRKIRGENELTSVDVEAVKSVEDECNEFAEGLMKKKKKKGKRGRPRKVQWGNEVSRSADIEAVKPEKDENSDIAKRLMKGKKKKGKRGRPPKLQVGNGALKSEAKAFRKGNLNCLVRNKRGLGMKKGLKQRMPIRREEMDKRLRGDKLYVVERVSPSGKRRCVDMETSKNAYLPGQSLGEENLVSINMQGCKKEKKSKTENGEIVTSRKMEKQLIRDQILKLLFSAGWTVDYRPRQGREYEDAVYVSPDGKTHWSITLAYNVLKKRYENGDVGYAYKEGFVFTPIPEEELKILTKVMVKKRKGKKKDTCMEEKVKADRVPKNKKMKRKLGCSGGSGLRKFIKGKKHELETMTDDSENEMPPSSGSCRCRETQKRKRYALLARNSGGTEIDSNMYVLYNGKRTVLAWMIDLGIVPDQGKVQYMNRKKTEMMLEGRVTKDGILCDCCNEVIGLSEFESHAGSESCLALQNIYLENGNSLLKCAIESWNKQEPEQNWFYFINVQGDDPNDDTCGICGDGGNLVCCDSCPSTFHQSCLDIERFPLGDWNCVYCSCKFCGSFHGNKSQRNDDGDTQESALLTCTLCKAKYHSSCNVVPQAGLEDLDKLQSFCGKSCDEIYKRTQMLLGVKHEIAEGYSWTLLQRSDVVYSEVSRKVECNSKLAVALSIMDECFCPLTDHRSGINLIRNILYNCGSNFNRLDFSGFFTIILERGEEIISAASIRIHGSQLAEMPFIGTRYVYRRQGMCRRLLCAIESVLSSLNVEKLVIPAVSEVKQTWTSVFDFVPVEVSTKKRMRSMNIMVFPGVDMLQKPLLDHDFSHKNCNTARGLKCSDVEDSKTIIDLNTIPEASAETLHPINGQLAVVKPNSLLLDGSLNAISDITSDTADCPNNDKCAAQSVIPGGTGEKMNVNGQHSISENCEQIAKADVIKSGRRDVEVDGGSYDHFTCVTKKSSSGDVSRDMNGVEGSCDASVNQIEDFALSLEAKKNAADVLVEELSLVQVDGTCLSEIIGKKKSCLRAQVSDKANCIACRDTEELANKKKSNGNMLQTTLSQAVEGEGPHAKTFSSACDKSASEVCSSPSTCEIDVSTSKLALKSDECDLHYQSNGLNPTEKRADFASLSSNLQSSLRDPSHAVMGPDLQSCASGYKQAEVALSDSYRQIEDINYGAKDGLPPINQKPLAESSSSCSEPNPRVSSNSDTGSMVDHASVPECIGESLCEPSLVHV